MKHLHLFLFKNNNIISEEKTDDILYVINILKSHNFKTGYLSGLEMYGYCMDKYWKDTLIDGYLVRNYNYEINLKKYPYVDYSKEVTHFLKNYKNIIRKQKIDRIIKK